MPLHLELFYSPHCPRCLKAREQLRSLAANWSEEHIQYQELDVLESLDRAVEVGVMQTPSLAVDGEAVAGPVPSPHALEKLLREKLRLKACS